MAYNSALVQDTKGNYSLVLMSSDGLILKEHVLMGSDEEGVGEV